MELKEREEKLSIEEKKSMALGMKLKNQFQQVKIQDMNTPDKLEGYKAEKFTREKSDLTKGIANLNEELSKSRI